MTVEVYHCGSGALNIQLDKAISTLPVDAKARDVEIPLVP